MQQATNWAPYLAIISSVLVATAGYVFTYFHKKRINERAAELDRVNLQLRNLYGPLYAELLSGQAAWESFSENYWPDHGKDAFFTEDATPTDEDKENWIAWREEVFHPKNERMESIIKENIDLLEEDGFPGVFTDLMAHIAGYKVVIRQWNNSDFSEYTSVCNFPFDELFKMVESQYFQLRAKQHALINGLQEEVVLSPGERERMIDFLENERHNKANSADRERVS